MSLTKWILAAALLTLMALATSAAADPYKCSNLCEADYDDNLADNCWEAKTNGTGREYRDCVDQQALRLRACQSRCATECSEFPYNTSAAECRRLVCGSGC